MSCIPTRCAHTGLLRAVCSANLYIFSHFYKYNSNFIPFLRDIVIYYCHRSNHYPGNKAEDWSLKKSEELSCNEYPPIVYA